MHIILGLLGSIVTILYLLDRLGIDIGGLNPVHCSPHQCCRRSWWYAAASQNSERWELGNSPGHHGLGGVTAATTFFNLYRTNECRMLATTWNIQTKY